MNFVLKQMNIGLEDASFKLRIQTITSRMVLVKKQNDTYSRDK